MIRSGELEIDSKGRIWRLKKRHGRGVAQGGGYELGVRISPCRRVRAEYRQKQGYLLIARTLNGERTVACAHRVVWSYFNGPVPDGLTINHKNGVKDDNHPDNLELMTYSEQRKHALEVLNVKRHRPIGSKHPKTHLNEQDVIRIRQLRQSGMMVKDIAKEYRMNPRAISAICRRRTWKHI